MVNTNIAAIRRAKTISSVVPNSGNWWATTGSMSPSENWTLAARTDDDAAAAKNRATYTMPVTSWMFDKRMLTRRDEPSIHMRNATMNQMNAMPAKGIR